MAYSKKHRGFLTLTMVLLVSVVVSFVATGVLLRSITQINETNDSEMSLRAWNTVNACGEKAVLELSTTTNGLQGWDYTGDESMSVGSESCYIYTVTDNGTAKVIQASSTVSGFTRKIEIEVATNTPSIIVNSWEAVADF